MYCVYLTTLKKLNYRWVNVVFTIGADTNFRLVPQSYFLSVATSSLSQNNKFDDESTCDLQGHGSFKQDTSTANNLLRFNHMKIWKSVSRSAILLSSFALVAGLVSPASAGDRTLVMPTERPRPVLNSKPVQWTENTLLVMPFSPGSEDATDLIKEVEGTIAETIGEGEMTVWVVKFNDSRHFSDAEKKFSKDKNVKNFQRDFIWHGQMTANDPYFPQQWHMNALNVPKAWDISQGGSNVIGVIDTGVNTSNSDLSGKCLTGYDSVKGSNGQKDVHGHGTMVSTTAAAIANNGKGTAGPAALSRIYPVCSSNSKGSFSSSAMIKGIQAVGNAGHKLINMSVNAAPPYTLANAKYNSSLHSYFKWFHDTKGGLIFNAAGNDAKLDSNKMVPYLIVVSAVNSSLKLASFSNYGKPVWFTAPGQGIYCSQGTGQVVSVSGTSFSSPLACSVAALVWGKKPSLTNLQVEQILKNSAGNGSWNQYFGYGMPDAEKALSQ